jgi:hypothetical protein
MESLVAEAHNSGVQTTKRVPCLSQTRVDFQRVFGYEFGFRYPLSDEEDQLGCRRNAQMQAATNERVSTGLNQDDRV